MNKSSRLVEIDALRGVAAIAVVFFHLTTRYMELYQFNQPPSFSFPHGHFGVSLFFIISGFVIFMTLEKTVRPIDFVVSRFSRLFPVYWVAVMLTFAVTHLLGLPGKLVDLPSALANLLMFHGLLRVPHVDGVYWTLEVELLFYCGMFLLFRLGRLNMIHQALWALLALRLVYFGLARVYGIDLPWVIFRLLILSNIPWFALGISIYLLTSRPGKDGWAAPVATGVFAIVTLLIAESVLLAALAIGMSGVVFLAASGRLVLLRNGVFAWLGAISYPLYLVHENIGWSIELRLSAWGASGDVTVFVALVVGLALATVLNRAVEKPAMRWIRNRYGNHSRPVVHS